MSMILKRVISAAVTTVVTALVAKALNKFMSPAPVTMSQRKRRFK
jgi:hypothetical protein